MKREIFEAALHDCLDTGLDPLADATVQQWLFEHPEDVEGVAELQERLAVLAAAAPAAPYRRRRLAAAAAILISIAAAATVWGSLRDDVPRPRVLTSEAGELVRVRVRSGTASTPRRRGILVEEVVVDRTWVAAPLHSGPLTIPHLTTTATTHRHAARSTTPE